MITLKHHLNFGPNFCRSTFCDAKLTTKYGDGCIPIHRNLLAAVSKKLRKRFDDNLEGSEPIVITNVDFNVLEKIVSYVYTGQATFASENVDYEDFCDGMSLLKIELGEEEKISPEKMNEPSLGSIIVKTECEEEYLEDHRSAAVEQMSSAPSTTSGCSADDDLVAADGNLDSVTQESKCGLESTGNVETIQVLPDLSDVASGTQNFLTSRDMNHNSAISIRTDLFSMKDDSTEDIEIEVLEIKETVELFLEELSMKISATQIKDYFSSFGEVTNVDLMETLYGRNSGLAIVKMKINETSQRKLKEVNPKINNRYFQILFKEDIVGNYLCRLDKRCGSNHSKLRMKGISRNVIADDIRDFFGRRNVREVYVEDENGYVEFVDFDTANKWNRTNITVRRAAIKVYRSWKDSSRSKPVARGRHGTRDRSRDYSVSPIRSRRGREMMQRK
eukprot:GFUD01006356.1.p1 GENE.GFUD01006356.1~~GFUD01006356.1.p1  ORF type:complete len:447 (+),score=117.41 GFUD01006356.1:169-1509(+)